MFLENIEIWNFKNYEQKIVQFHEHLNIIVGKNGSGKTNLLDAIYYLCLTQSAFHSQDTLNIRHDADFFIIKGNFQKQQQHNQIICSYQNKKKTVQKDRQAYTKLSEHIGFFPVVLVTPNDTDLVRDGSELRRRFFDTILCQIRQDYLQKLMFYNQLLKNRNAVLKQFFEKNHFDEILLERFDKELIPLNIWIGQERKTFLEKLMPFFQDFYNFLTNSTEKTQILYQTDVLEKDFEQRFRNNQNQDLQAQRTTFGVHKDDFLFELQGLPLRKFGSQGQQKSFVLALKIAHWQLISQEKGFKALLLLDDIFDKLDAHRLEALADWLGSHAGQVFITDAHLERSMLFFGKKNDFVRVEIA